MLAELEGEDEEYIKIYSTDNADTVHDLTIEKKNGEIVYHDQDGYPDDPSERTEVENEHVNQARRFARYWVYRQRGYDTLDAGQNPDRILAAVIAIAPLAPETARQYFGNLYEHFRSIYGDATSPIEMPANVDPKDAVYLQDIYLGFGDQELDAAMANALAHPEIMQMVGHAVEVGGDRPPESEIVPKLHELLAEVANVDPETLPALRDGLLIDAVSGVHVQYGSLGHEQTVMGDQPDIDRPFDARIETYRYDAESVTDLQIRLAKHLICQVRDCYLLMGIAPPEPFRIQGYGRRNATGWYNTIDLYDEYADPEASIDTWFEAETPDDAYHHKAEQRPNSE